MALVQVRELELQSANPARYVDGFRWRIKLTALTQLRSPVEVRFIWVGSEFSNAHDQLLDELEVGPCTVGDNEFTVDIDPPNWKLIPPNEVLGLTVLQIVFLYEGAAFLTVGYYVNVAYFNDDMNSRPPAIVNDSLLGRNLLIAKPAVTTHSIGWGDVDEDE